MARASGAAPHRSAMYLAGALAHDALASGAAFALALAIATGWAALATPEAWLAVAPGILTFALIGGAMSYGHHLHRAVWRYTSLADAIRIVRASTLTALISAPVFMWVPQFGDLPHSAPILAFFFMAALIAAPRVLVRSLADGRTPRPFTTILHNKLNPLSAPAIVIGRPARIEPFIRELHRDAERAYTVVGILTDGADWHGRHIHGIAVLGGAENLAEALVFMDQRGIRPQRLIIADDEIDEDQILQLLELASQNGMTVGRLPRLMDFSDEAAAQARVARPIALGDLLGRPQVVLDRAALHRLIAGQRVLITGAGGSIGSELARQIGDFGPSRLVLVENSEFNLYRIAGELDERGGGPPRRDVLCDVRHEAAIQRLFSEERPDLVFHAAALKHVPLVEANPIQGAITNVLGVQAVAEACARHGARAMVLISTDKAVNPHNVMGATKRWAEAYCQAMDLAAGDTRYAAVRFGNVLGSTGSVAPLFERQIAAGGPVTVTHPDVTRFFMTISEAVQLVLQASAMGLNAEAARGEVYVLDMGKPIKIVDLARQMIRLSGKRPDLDIPITFIGLRPGEKLHEELVHEHERHTPQGGAGGAFAISPRTTDLAILRRQMAELARAAEAFDEAKVLRLIKAAVPEFAYQGEVSDARG